MRLSKVTLVVIATACVAVPLASWRDGKPKPSPSFEVELERITQEIAELKENAFVPPIEIDQATRFVYLLYHRVSLTGDFAELRVVEAALDNAIRQLGPWDDLYLLKANLDFKLHRLASAKDDLRMLRSGSESVQVETLKADIDLQEGRYEDARQGYQKAIQSRRRWDALARLAYLESKTGDPNVADRLYKEAQEELSAKEMRFYAWVELQRGLLDLRRGRYEDAWVHYRQANRAYSGYWLIDEYMAEVLGAQRKFDEAAALYHKIIQRAPRPELHQALGDLYLFMGKPNLARPWHEKALAAYLESAQRGEVHYYHHLASFYADLRQDGAEAVKWARKDLELRQNFATQEALAWALYRGGRFAEAVDAVDEALSSGVKDAHLFFHAALIHLAGGRPETGKQLVKRAVEINPGYENFHVHR